MIFFFTSVQLWLMNTQAVKLKWQNPSTALNAESTTTVSQVTMTEIFNTSSPIFTLGR